MSKDYGSDRESSSPTSRPVSFPIVEIIYANSLGLKFFWKKNIGEKAAHKMLVKFDNCGQF